MITPEYKFDAICERVIDGDTFRLRIETGFYVSVSVSVRLRGVDAPEPNTDEGKAAKRLVEDLLGAGTSNPTPLVVESYKGRQSFARWVCDVWLPDGSPLADRLIGAGYDRR